MQDKTKTDETMEILTGDPKYERLTFMRENPDGTWTKSRSALCPADFEKAKPVTDPKLRKILGLDK